MAGDAGDVDGTDFSAAIDWAERLRDRRAQFCAEQAAGGSIMRVRAGAEAIGPDDPLGDTTLLSVLDATEVLGGKVSTRRALVRCGIPLDAALNALSPDAWDALAMTAHGSPVIIVLCGPGGVGKGTVVGEWMRRDPRLWLSQSWTTRDPRPGESPDAYIFATREEFEAKVEAGGFLEWVSFLDYLQGSPVPEPPAGCDVIFEIDVHGAKSIKDRYPDALLVYIDAPSREIQRQRLEHRGDPPERVAQRIERAEHEFDVAVELGCVMLINHEVDDTVAELSALLADRRGSRPETC